MDEILGKTNWGELFLFAASCGVAALIVFMIDAAYGSLKNKPSFLEITYSSQNWIVPMIFWVVGAAGIALVAAFADLVKINKPTIVVLGMAWPILVTKIFNRAQEVEPNADEGDAE